MIEVYIESEQDKQAVDEALEVMIRKAIAATAAHVGFMMGAEVSVLLTDDEQIHALNLEHRQKDAPTDVLSFPMLDFDEKGDIMNTDPVATGEAILLGDVVISMERAAAQAEEYGHSIQREIAFLTVHSMLHLFGYDHETGEAERKQMRGAEETVLNGMGLVRNK